MKTLFGFWARPLGYAHGVVLCGSLVLIGLAVEWTAGRDFTPPSWPISGILLMLFAGWLGGLAILFRNHPVIQWLGSIPVTLCCLATLFVLGTIAGFFEQGESVGPLWMRRLGMNHVTTSTPFILSILLLLTNLGVAALRKMAMRLWRQWFFALNHIGIWVALACGFFGAGDVARLHVVAREGNSTFIGFDEKRRAYRLPFTVLLRDFQMEEYPATSPPKPKRFASEITLFEHGKGPRLATIEVNKPVSVQGWKLYQRSYDQAAGNASTWSVIEAVKDPWLPGVYTGIGLMLAGACAMLLRGNAPLREALKGASQT